MRSGSRHIRSEQNDRDRDEDLQDVHDDGDSFDRGLEDQMSRIDKNNRAKQIGQRGGYVRAGNVQSCETGGHEEPEHTGVLIQIRHGSVPVLAEEQSENGHTVQVNSDAS